MSARNPALPSDLSRQRRLALAHVVPDAVRCMQCGICSYNCPVGIDVRAYAWRGQPVLDSSCLTCGQCVARCPRRALRFERLLLPGLDRPLWN